MLLDIPSMLIGIAVVIAAPVAAAAVYNERHGLAMTVDKTRAVAKKLQSKRDRQELELEGKHGKESRALQKQVGILGRALDDSLAKESQIKKVLLQSREKGASLQKLVEQKPNAKIIEKMFNWRMARTDALEKSLGKQESLVKKQQVEFQTLTEDCKISIMQKDVAISKERQTNAHSRALSLFSKFEETGEREAIKRMESKVVEKEKKATEGATAIVERLRQTQSKEVDDLTAQITLKMQQCESKLKTVQEILSVMDSNVTRAFERLKKQQSIAAALAKQSLMEEDKIEIDIAERAASARSLQDTAERKARKGNNSFADSLPQRLQHLNEQREELIVALRAHRLRNLALHQRLFDVEGIITRLFLIQLMLDALPDKKIELVSQCQALSRAARSYLKNDQNSKSNESDENFDLLTRLSALESRTQLATIKEGKRTIPLDMSLTLTQHFSDVRGKMESEKLLHEPQLKKWKGLAKDSLEEEKELTHMISSKREQQHAEIIEVINQNVKVLTSVIDWLRIDRWEV